MHCSKNPSYQEISMMDLSNSSWMTTRGRFKHVSYRGEKSKLMRSLRTAGAPRLTIFISPGALVTSTNIHGIVDSSEIQLPKNHKLGIPRPNRDLHTRLQAVRAQLYNHSATAKAEIYGAGCDGLRKNPAHLLWALSSGLHYSRLLQIVT